MTHRVLLDFSCEAARLGSEQTAMRVSDRQMVELESELVRRLRRHLVETGWESQFEDEATSLFNQMAKQLPDDDLPSFVRNTKFTMSRKAPKAYLTVGHFCDAGVGRVRLRIGARSEAVLVDLGRIVANGAITTMPELRLNKMELFEARADVALLSAGERLAGSPPYRFFSRPNLTVWLPFAFSTVFLLAGLAVQWRNAAPWHTDFFNNAFGQWYGRLVGPTGMAIVTTLSVAARDRRTAPRRRVVEWDLQSSSEN